ncbi:YggT family protein [Herminiimonas fonticola]|uniref:YggT family protein n=1 Tax=Herminiimonas fonticola TaxID=303380 RepID=A0A4R6GHG2_9BURK|nr:YggT family protein [Herminiimonas fonticola]RBA25162.1 YGGT family [Herminiimonas fonticola]TDN94277.1 YggT family protein [Herminiimonas fonticola]
MLDSIFALIIDTVAIVLAGALLLRFWMQAVRVRPPMEIAQFTYQLTDWLVRPLRRILPGAGGYDWASLIGAFLVALVATAFEVWLRGAFAPHAILLLTVLRICQWALYGLIGLLLIEVIFSWVNPHAPLAPFVRALNDPLMRPLRRIVPLLGTIDLSPLVALILLRIAIELVTTIVASLL